MKQSPSLVWAPGRNYTQFYPSFPPTSTPSPASASVAVETQLSNAAPLVWISQPDNLDRLAHPLTDSAANRLWGL